MYVLDLSKDGDEAQFTMFNGNLNLTRPVGDLMIAEGNPHPVPQQPQPDSTIREERSAKKTPEHALPNMR
jgi:hypothetical protein